VDVEAEYRKSIPPEAWAFLVEYQGLANPEMYGEVEEIRDMIVEFVRSGLPAWKRCFARMERSAEAYQRRRGGPTSTRSARPRVYGATQAKRLALLRCVAPRVVPVANRSKRGFDTAGHPIHWEQVHAEFKRDHPEYRGSAEALERAYRRAKTDRRVCELYFDGELRNWAEQADRLRHTLRTLGMAGLRPEDVFVRFVTTDGSYEPDTRGLSPELASAIKHMASYKKWMNISFKLSPGPGRAFERAVSNSCGLTVAHRVAYPRDQRFCEGPHCRKCKVGAGLVKVGLARQEDLVELTAAGAGERHRRRLDESAQRLRKLFESIDNRSRG